MFKKILIYIVLALLYFVLKAHGQTLYTLSGSIVNENGQPISNVTLKIDKQILGITNKDGQFRVRTSLAKGTLVFTAIGFKTQAIVFEGNGINHKIIMQEEEATLDEVQVVNTGYQTLSKERATGSFVHIDNELLNRNGASTNLLERIDGIASGVIFNNKGFENSNIGARQGRQAAIEVRGRSTIFSPAEPLIVLDNFPYDGDLANINPNDIESVTVLKDAAAASAWGSSSGNGVIIITTKKGKLNSTPKVSFISSVSLAQKPNVYNLPQLSSTQYIEVQQFLFDRGAYNSIINTGYTALAPAVEIMLARRNGEISATQETAQLAILQSYDVREQLLRYNYRNALQQQYQTSISGGTATQRYFVSLGYNNNQNGTVNNTYERLTLNASNTYYFLKNRLELFSNIIYTASIGKNGPSLSATYPYTQFADANGTPLIEARDFRIAYASTAGNGKLLNWLYSPLDEVRNGYGTTTSDLTSYRLNFSLSYTVLKGLKVSTLYGFEKATNEVNTLNELQSYYTRNLINRYSQINPNTGAVAYPMPMGAILNNSSGNLAAHNGRFQANYYYHQAKHTIRVLAGSEIKDQNRDRKALSWYGYDPETGLNQNGAMSFTTNYPVFYNPLSTSRINFNTSQTGSTNRFFSYFFNGSYDYAEKYIASFSARRDESNLFGVATNQKGVPLWSTGLAWKIDREPFYHLAWLPHLKLRSTFGYTGNVNNSISAYLTANHMVLNAYDTNYATIVNPPNPDLRWEKISNTNLGLDFATKANRLSGSLDFWRKKGLDLIGNSPIAPQTGVSLYTGNSANTLTKGVDLQLNSNNLNGALKWATTLLYNYTTSKVTDYKVSNGNNLNVVSANYNNPLEGYPLYAVFSFRYAGLNAVGAPQGYVNGELSTDYTSILNATDRTQLIYHGSAVPTSYGSLRNTFGYKGFELSFNVLYKFGYYFRRGTLENGSLYSTGSNYRIADYEKRWQQPGDEMHTDVPALVYPAVTARTNLYTNAHVLVERGDHIRLQDFRFGYTLQGSKLAVKSLHLFSYFNNLGILWRANKHNIDPDSPRGMSNVATIAFGLRADF